MIYLGDYMKKNIEKEYKILVTKEQFYSLLERYPNITFESQTNYYIDTENQMLRAMQGAMRIRHINNQYIFTLKLPSEKGLLEFEKEVASASLESLEDEKIKNLLEQYHIDGNFQFTTKLHTQRAIHRTPYAELCFDISTYNQITDYEIEYEYLCEHDGLQAFQDILKPIQVIYTKNCDSKIKRALDSL